MELFVKWITSLIGAVFAACLAGYWANITFQDRTEAARAVELPLILLVAAVVGWRLGLAAARSVTKD